jgi:AraC family transcriptional regulator
MQIANDTMNYIYEFIDTDINIDELALRFNVSKFHFHKIFKEQMNANIYETIKSIRLQKASNLLITNKSSTVTQIANMCGYSSQTSFIRAFKKRFNQTPKIWRNGAYKLHSNEILNSSKVPLYSLDRFSKLEVNIVKAKKQTAYYIRHKGYNKEEVKKVWQKMLAWIYTNDIKEYTQIGIYHDNPIITPHKECFYVAAVIPNDNVDLSTTNLPRFEMRELLYATFDLKGKYGDMLRLVQWAYHEWLPHSGFETTTNPSYAIFRKNQFLDKNEEFDATYYLPIRYV